MTERGSLTDAVAAQATAVLDVVRASVPPAVVRGVYLYGSAVAAGLRPDSDLDVLAVIDRPLLASERRALVDGLVPVSWRAQRPAGWRPVELTIVVRGEIEPWRYPPVRDFQYGEWARDELVADPGAAGPVPSPDLAILLTTACTDSTALDGNAVTGEIPEVPADDVRRAIRDELPGLPLDLATDTRNVLLTLARMWCTMETGRIVPKDQAAEWAIPRLPAHLRQPLVAASAAYRGDPVDDVTCDARVQALSDLLVDVIGGR